MSIFEQLTQAVADYNTVWAAFRSSKQEAQDVTNAVGERIKADRRQIAERRTMLEAQSRDPARPEIVRKLAVQELERTQGRTFTPMEDETAAFTAAMADAETALRDAAAVKVKLLDLFHEAEKELRTLRANTLGNQRFDTDLAQRHLDVGQQAFDRLSQP